MDLGTLDAVIAEDEEGAVIPIFQKNGEPYTAPDGTQSTITVLGTESKRYRAARNQVSRRLLKSNRSTVEPADIERQRIDLATAAVTAWHGWELNGTPAQCTPENVRQVFRLEHILEQVEEGIRRHADFFPKNSSA